MQNLCYAWHTQCHDLHAVHTELMLSLYAHKINTMKDLQTQPLTLQPLNPETRARIQLRARAQ